MTPPTNRRFADQLQRLLKEKGVRQSELAARINVSRNSVSAWCKGEKIPGIDRKKAIAAALEVPVFELLDSPLEPTSEISASDLAAAAEAYQRDSGWRMRPMPSDGGRQGGNAAAFAFNPNPATLIREVGQNSTDERLMTAWPPTVQLVLSVYELGGEPLQKFLDAIQFPALRAHLKAAATENHKVGNIINAGLNAIGSNLEGPLRLLRIDDYNATGLIGPERGKASKHAAVMRNVLDSEKAENRGGSYGLGSNVMWACSQWGLVLSNSVLSEPENGEHSNRVLGCVQLPSHETGDVQWAGPGWFGRINNASDGEEVADSYWNNPALVGDLQLTRDSDQPGSTFLIVQAYDPSGTAQTLDEWHDKLVEAAADHFWAAMTDISDSEPARLQVIVRTRRIGFGKESTNRDTVVDPSDIVPERVAMLRKYYSGQTVEALDNPGDVVAKSVPLHIPARAVQSSGHPPTTHDAILLIAQVAERSASTNRLQAMRGSLMTIVDQEVRSLPLGSRAFQAVLLAGEAASEDPDARAAERMLRASEPPAHNKWESTSDLTESYARGAVTEIERFLETAKEEIRRTVGRPRSDESDGPESLRSLLRMVEPTDAVKRPTIRRVDSRLNEDGAWEVQVTVGVPRDSEWRLSPVIKFSTESGGGIPVRWAELTAVDKCSVERDAGWIMPEGGASQAKFRGVSDPGSHPVPAAYSRAEIELRPMKGGAA